MKVRIGKHKLNVQKTIDLLEDIVKQYGEIISTDDCMKDENQKGLFTIDRIFDFLCVDGEDAWCKQMFFNDLIQDVLLGDKEYLMWNDYKVYNVTDYVFHVLVEDKNV